MKTENSNQFYRIVIIEDNDELRETYELLIKSFEDFNVVNTYSNCEEAIKKLQKDSPDLILIDLSLPGMNGIEGTMRIRKINPAIKVLVITVHDDYEHVFDALCAGAIGYITKDLNQNDLMIAINQVLSGGAPMSPKIANLIIKSFHRNPETPLTERETDVLKQLAKGKTYDYIARDLFISKDTVKTHIKHIYDKLQVSNKSDALIKARKDNLV
jgi:DNA-binding NarL/FixJ family response regulator